MFGIFLKNVWDPRSCFLEALIINTDLTKYFLDNFGLFLYTYQFQDLPLKRRGFKLKTSGFGGLSEIGPKS